MSDPIPNSIGPADAADEIARLNDQLREHITQPGNNRVMMTSGIADLIGEVTLFRNFRKRAELLRSIRGYDSFTPGNDPYGEHDFGTFTFEDTACMWKIDYYNADLTAGTDNPADPSVTVRVLTILRADEW